MLAQSMFTVIETTFYFYSKLTLRKQQFRQFSMVSVNVRHPAHNGLKRI